MGGFSELANQTLPVSIFLVLVRSLEVRRISGCCPLGQTVFTSLGPKLVKYRGCRALGYRSLFPLFDPCTTNRRGKRGLGLLESESGTVKAPLLGGGHNLICLYTERLLGSMFHIRSRAARAVENTRQRDLIKI